MKMFEEHNEIITDVDDWYKSYTDSKNDELFFMQRIDNILTDILGINSRKKKTMVEIKKELMEELGRFRFKVLLSIDYFLCQKKYEQVHKLMYFYDTFAEDLQVALMIIGYKPQQALNFVPVFNWNKFIEDMFEINEDDSELIEFKKKRHTINDNHTIVQKLIEDFGSRENLYKFISNEC